MTKIQWLYLLLAALAIFGIASIGIAIAEASIIIAVISIAVTCSAFYFARKVKANSAA
ncbi:hypothetical protein SAMN05421781_0135 [Marinococcus luteus]|uniref:Uncharacterized protein n=1 Tax=Marinococcus luteus TaxID=1122204 RepID=A0A1H2Q489_9BACI|nr:DUF5325 family protein [Marinococcus luteus]SDW01913.1 hypothetical protein SAMN05421781_0135 [Marinococcus luteus]